jgi:16S rRNA (guanine966-N2)-methyltransferase
MRIVAGTFKGHPISAPKGADTRPTSDRVREAVFSSLGSLGVELDGSAVLDLFCGSGAMGLEAVSRGASRAVLVDTARSAVATAEANIERLCVRGAVRVLMCDAFKLVRGPAPESPFALLFLDPPYRIDPARVRQLLEDAAASDLLSQGAVVVYELSAREEPTWPDGFSLVGSKAYGGTRVAYSIWRKEQES